MTNFLLCAPDVDPGFLQSVPTETVGDDEKVQVKAKRVRNLKYWVIWMR